MASGLDIEARLVVTMDGDDIQIAGSGSYLIVNLPNQRVLDKLTSGPPKPPGAKKPKPPAGNAPDPCSSSTTWPGSWA
ncbi:hypothetical protein [Hymenobacter cellulosivorans]|uniref:Uncharacterized protein n=1 Tax=Hymenobacter cellulosivorans TaxID=2932249 RepID=A0ABY4F5V2_9BACT|nr:hypothetical protein [Hymenobacter cellulosivorans]UOQ51492.1 hypothetical protein MUN80_17200 [Hymenobacter cellulosivorans]